MTYAWIVVPLLAAFFGWIAVRVVMILLFHPVNPIRLGGWTVQGLLPARHNELAEKLGGFLGKEMVQLSSDMEKKIADPGNFQKIMPYVEEHIDQFLRVRLVQKMPMIGMLIGEKTIAEMKAVFIAELETLFPVIMKNYMNSLQAGNEPEEIVTRKIKQVSLSGLENSLHTVLKKELRYLGILGAISGFVVGLIQVFVLQLL